MNKRLGICLASLMVFPGLVSTNLRSADLPNVLMIIADDQMWADYGFMGHRQIETPHLDRLASQSLTFMRGYVPDSLCRPSLATIITGLYPHQHRIVGNDPPVPKSLQGQPPGKVAASAEYREICDRYIEHIDRAATLPKLLAEKGYWSLQTGKWWEGNFRRGGFTHGMTHGDRSRGGRHGDQGLTIGRDGLEPIYNFIAAAQAEEKPFFIWYAPMLPHTPHNPPPRLLDKYHDKVDSPFIAKYWAMCEWFDETVGQLLDHLDEQHLSENTIVTFVADNGWINQTGGSRYAPKSKRSQYDGGIRTPIMIRWPAKVKPRRDDRALASSIDLAPTILRACRLQPTPEMQGIDLLDEKAVAERRQVPGEIFEHDVQHLTDPVPSLRYRWVIDRNTKLIIPHLPRVPDGRLELYDLDVDPFEMKNLAASRPADVSRLTKMLDQWWPVE